MANRALARKKRCNIIPISPNALATSDVISPPRFAVRMSQIPWGTSIAPTSGFVEMTGSGEPSTLSLSCRA